MHHPMFPSPHEYAGLKTHTKTMKHFFKESGHALNAAMNGSVDENNSFGVQSIELADVRTAILYILGNTKMTSNAVPISTQGMATSLITSSMASVLNTDVVSHAGNLSAAALKLTKQHIPASITDAFKKTSTSIVDGLKELFDKLDSKINDIFEKAVSKWYKDNAPYVDPEIQKFTGRITAQKLHGKFIDLVCESIRQLTPGLSEIRDIKKLIDRSMEMCTGLATWAEELFCGRGQTALKGAPDIMQKCIRNQHIVKLGANTFELVKGGGCLTAAIFTGPAGKLVVKLLTLVQKVLHWFYMLLQSVSAQYTLSRASREWQKWNSENESIKATCFLNNPEEFNRWFRGGVILSPVIGQLCLTTGFTAHPMRFLQLIDERGATISQKKYTRGEKYIDTLKESATVGVNGFCEAYGFDFTSSDPLLEDYFQNTRGGGRNKLPSITFE